MAICENSMFDICEFFLVNVQVQCRWTGESVFLTDEKGNFLREKGIHVSDRDYDRFAGYTGRSRV